MFFVDRWPSGVGIGGLGGDGVVGLFMAAWVVSSLCMCGSVPAGSRRGSGTVVCGQNNVVHVKWFLPTRSIIGWNVLRICRASARGPKAVIWLANVARQRCATQPFYLNRRKVVCHFVTCNAGIQAKPRGGGHNSLSRAALG